MAALDVIKRDVTTASVAIEGEVARRRQGIIRLSLSSGDGLLRYSDESHWNKSYVRALTPREIATLKMMIASWPDAASTDDARSPISWSLTLRTAEATYERHGAHETDETWRYFLTVLERLGVR